MTSLTPSSSSPSSPASKNFPRIAKFQLRPATEADLPIMARQQCTMAFETEGRDMTPDEHIGGLSLAVTKRHLTHVQVYVAEASLDTQQEFPTPTTSTSSSEHQEMEVCGMLMIRPEFSLLRNSSVFSIEDVYTEEKFRSKGVWRRCFNEVWENRVLRSSGAFVGMRLFCDYKNEVAIAAYKRVGMFLEHGRPFRWCQAKCEAPRADPSAEDIERMKINSVASRPNESSDDFGRTHIHRVVLSEDQVKDSSSSSLIDELADMVWLNSRNFNRWANNEEPRKQESHDAFSDDIMESEKLKFDKKFNISTLRKGITAAIQSRTGIVTNKNKKNDDDNNKPASEFYLIRGSKEEKNDASCLLGCFNVTFELCTWRGGFILWIQNFSVSDQTARGTIFRSVIRYFQKIVEGHHKEEVDEKSFVPFAGVRFELDPEIEARRYFGEENDLVKIAKEEAFEFEDDILMRIDQ